MTQISDEDLMAYADNALEANERARISSALATDASLQARLQAFETTPDLLAIAYPIEPANPALASKLRAEPSPDPVVVPFRAKAKTAPGAPRTVALWHLAAAACVALAVGGLMDYQVAGPSPSGTILAETQGLQAGTALAAVLSDAPSLQRVALADQQSATATLTFQDREGRYCREFQLNSASAAAVGVACRGSTAAGWQIEALVRGEAEAADDGAYGVASGGSAVEAVIDDLIAGDALSPADEAAAIARGWTVK